MDEWSPDVLSLRDRSLISPLHMLIQTSDIRRYFALKVDTRRFSFVVTTYSDITVAMTMHWLRLLSLLL